MSTPDKPSTSPEILEKKAQLPGAFGLLKVALKREFGTPLNPAKFDSLKKNSDIFEDKVRTHMRDIRTENKEEWASITDEMIDSEANKETLIEQMNHFAKDLVFRRKRAFDRATDFFPGIKSEKSNWQELLRSKLAGFNENELQTLLTRRSAMKKALMQLFPDATGVSTEAKLKLDSVFHDRNAHFDALGIKRVERILLDYEKYNQVPDWENMSFILEGYKGASDSRKKELLTALEFALTIKQAYEQDLIDTAFLTDFAKSEWEDLYTTLPDDKQKAFVRSLSQNDTHVISARDFSEKGLSQVFSAEKKRNELSKEISKSIGVDIDEKPFGGNEILSEIRREQKKLHEEDSKNNRSGTVDDTDNYDLHAAFVDKMARTLPNGGSIEHLKQAGSVVQFEDSAGNIQFVKLVRYEDENGFPLETELGNAYGVELQGLSVVDGKIRNPENFRSSYDTFARFLRDQKNAKVLSSHEFEALMTKNPEEAKDGKKFLDVRTLEVEPVTKDNIAAKLDLIDSLGSEFGFEKGTCFMAPSTNKETGTTNTAELWRVERINGDTVDLMDANGMSTHARGIPLTQVYQILSESEGFKRIAKIASSEDMVKALTTHGLSAEAVIEDGKIIQKLKDDHGHVQNKEITSFKSEKGGHIKLESIQDGVVKFGEFNEKSEIKDLREHAKKHGNDKVIKGHYDWQAMSYPAFLDYLDKGKFKATTEDLIIPDAHHKNSHNDHHHPPHAHMEGSFLKRILQLQNPASIMKGFELIWHGIEHTLEKGAKLDAARFAMGTAKFLKLPDGVSAQIYADIVGGSKEIIEKYEQKIFGLPGPRGRWKCIHIAHNRDSRPEEVMSAINYMIKSYGHLYAEDVKHFQPVVSKRNLETADPGYFAFFDGLVLTTKVGNLKYWRMEAYKKAISEMGTADDHENEPTEEQLIHAFCKIVDGEWEQYPYAASVVKAMGGPSGYEKNWKFEGFDNAFKKGKDQSQMVNAQGRLNKAVGYFGTHEIYKAIGAMEAVAAKGKEPKFQAMPFIWAVGGYSRFASHTALQKLKGYAENGMSFHAFSFLRNEAYNNVYRDTVRLALEELGGSSLVNEFDGICKQMEFDAKNNKSTKGAAIKMMEFWQKHQHTGLHDMLQGQNGWLLKMKKGGNKTVTTYVDTLSNGHMMQLNDPEIPGSDYGKDWYLEHGYQNIIMSQTKDGFRSLSRMLNKIQFEGTSPGGGRPMKDDHNKKIWHYMKEYINGSLRDTDMFLGDEALQKEQYLAHRREIIQYFQQKLNTRVLMKREDPKRAKDIMEANIRDYSYFADLADMGITPESIFDADVELSEEESDYKMWKSGGRKSGATSSSSSQGVRSVKSLVQGKTAETVNKDSPKRVRRATDNDEEWHDPDDSGVGAPADVGENN